MKTVCNGTPLTIQKISPAACLEPGLLNQQPVYSTEVPTTPQKIYVRNLCSSSYMLLIVPQYLSKANFHSPVALPVGRRP